jgi:glycosyltransferase involved in cell wall biosynthesis
MRVACIGNMNNNFFALARYLRDNGISADVMILDYESAHFHPSHDCYDRSYQSFTKRLTWGGAFGFAGTPAQTIADDLRPYDFLIGCGTAPAYVERIGRRLDIFMPYGDDIYRLPFFRLVNPRHQVSFLLCSRAQLAGIRNSRVIWFDAVNPETEAVLDRIGGSAKRIRMGIPMLYTPLYDPAHIAEHRHQTHWAKEFESVRRQSDLLVFHHSRLYWKRGGWNQKDNDRLVRGFARFARERRDVRPKLILLEYGEDVEATRALIRDLEIEPFVEWFPLMARKDLMVGLSMADLATGEFHRSWLSCGTIYEALAMAKPLLHYRQDHLYAADYPELYPMVNITTDHDVHKALADFVARPEEFRDMGARGRQWLRKYVLDPAVHEAVRMIKGAG